MKLFKLSVLTLSSAMILSQAAFAQLADEYVGKCRAQGQIARAALAIINQPQP